MPYIIGGVVAIITAVIGFVSGSAHRRKSAEAAIGSAEEEAKRILSDAMKNAEQRKKEALLEAKDEIHQLRQETEKDLRERRSEVQRQEHRDHKRYGDPAQLSDQKEHGQSDPYSPHISELQGNKKRLLVPGPKFKKKTYVIHKV